MGLTSLLEQLSQELEIPMPEADKKGQYRIAYDGDNKLIIYDLDPGIALHTELAPVPPNDQEGFFSEALLANLFGQGTTGAVLGLSPDAKTLTLSREIDYNIEYKDFRDIVEDFLNAADVWRSEATHVEPDA